jgi:hypothetical protein
MNEHYTDEEIYEMLKPKFYKNFGYHKYFEELTQDKIIEMIALTYRSGYGRGKKNRPFVIGGPKKEYVIFTNKELHREYPDWYPYPGTIGKIVEMNASSCLVNWSVGGGTKTGPWWVNVDDIILVTKKLASELKIGNKVILPIFLEEEEERNEYRTAPKTVKSINKDKEYYDVIFINEGHIYFLPSDYVLVVDNED